MLWRSLVFHGVQRDRAKIRFWVLLTRLDFADLLLVVIEMAQPEYWA
jgi:hypothetical protein